MIEQTTAITTTWRDGQVLDVLAAISTLTHQVAATTLFPAAASPRLLREIRRDLAILVNRVYQVMLLPWLGRRHYDRTITRLRQNIATLTATDHRAGGDDMLSTLVNPPQPGAPVFSDSEIIDQVIAFIFAGYETTANALSWALHLLAQHPDVQHRLHAEADRVLAGATPPSTTYRNWT